MSDDPSIPDVPTGWPEPDATRRRPARVSTEQLTDADFPVGFGRYKLQSLLGEGGMARVFRAELHGPAGFRKQVALKVIKSETSDRANEKETMDLIREACLGGRIKHPHIVDVYELGEVDGQVFISMELVDGVTLSQLIRTRADIPSSVLLEVAVAVAAGLAKADSFEEEGRRVGLVHRDLKPANILLSWDGAVKIADFGIAITRNDVSENGNDKKAMGVSGTPSYMSPEQFLGEELDGRSDLFAFALVVTAMVLGSNPLGNRFVVERLLVGQALEPPLLDGETVRALNEVGPGLGEVLLGCLEPDCANRTPSAGHVLQQLRAVQDKVGNRPRLADWLPTAMADADAKSLGQTSATRRPVGADGTSGASMAPTEPAVKGNLGNPLDGFVGREEELSAIGSLFAQGARLVTVKGTGGAGKTRLGRSYARRAVPDVDGGAWFVDLTEARTPMGLVQATAMALNVPLRGEDLDGLVMQLGSAIAGRGAVLLVLDNFEQVVEHAAMTLGRWLDMAPEARFLVTSRESLRLSGERVFPLKPLPEADGIALFALRARAAGANWQETPENRAAIVGIVNKLDGLPLAIELAAARARLLALNQLLERLSDRFKLLAGGRRGDTNRQRTLRGMIDWSWELLEPWEQSALLQLSVFHDGFFMEAAEAVLDLSHWPDAPWSLDVVGSLLDKSLLHSREVHGQPRFGMYVSIQEYAAEKLESGLGTGADQFPVANLRHAAHFASFGGDSFLDSLDTHGGVVRRKALAFELENLLAGVDAGLVAGEPEVAAGCALAAGWVFNMQGPFSDGVALLQRVSGQPVSRGTQGRLFQKTGLLLRLAGRPAEALEHLDQALPIACEVGNRRFEGLVLGALALLHYEQGRFLEAIEHYDQALPIARDEGNRRDEGIILGNLANLHRDQGRLREALEHYHQTLAIHREVGNRRFEGVILGNLGLLHYEQGRLPEALEHYHQALAIAREVGNRRFEGAVLGNLAPLHYDQGRLPEALEHYHQALAIHREVGNRRSEGIDLGNIGDLLFSQGDLAAAQTHFQQAIAIGDETLPAAAGAFRGSLALIRAQEGAFDEARSLLDIAELQLHGVHKLEVGKLLCKKARVEHLGGDPAAAAAALAEAESIAVELGGDPESELGDALAEARAALSH